MSKVWWWCQANFGDSSGAKEEFEVGWVRWSELWNVEIGWPFFAIFVNFTSNGLTCYARLAFHESNYSGVWTPKKLKSQLASLASTTVSRSCNKSWCCTVVVIIGGLKKPQLCWWYWSSKAVIHCGDFRGNLVLNVLQLLFVDDGFQTQSGWAQ